MKQCLKINARCPGHFLKQTTVIVCFVFFFFFSTILSISGPLPVQEDFLLKARALIRKGDFEAAIDELLSVIRELKTRAAQEKNLANAYYLMARVYKIVQMEKECTSYLKKVFETYPGFSIREPDKEMIDWVERVKAELGKDNTVNVILFVLAVVALTALTAAIVMLRKKK
jgi:tetratricopeptide (TPR) repeat protein